MVRIFDTAACVVKSDTLISSELNNALIKAITELFEDVPERMKDWHPGSNGQVLDLVHPSLFPLVYGRTRILSDSTIGLDDCLQHICSGKTIPIPLESEGMELEYDTNLYQPSPRNLWSTKFQWLPCDVHFTDEGLKILSYINNIHPVRQRALYPLIEQVMTAALPMWDQVLGFIRDYESEGDLRRIRRDAADYSSQEGEEEEDEDEEEDDWSEGQYAERNDRRRTLIFPNPPAYDSSENKASVSHAGHLRELFASNSGSSGLQIIVKLANIVLTPEKPEYPGGSWHVEGQLNEHICATAIYYYDCLNVTDSHLGFRQKVDTYGPEENTEGQVRIGQCSLVTIPNLE